jgi:hypothetical protein
VPQDDTVVDDDGDNIRVGLLSDGIRLCPNLLVGAPHGDVQHLFVACVKACREVEEGRMMRKWR